MKIDEVLSELGIDPKTAPKQLKVKNIGKRTVPLVKDKTEKQLLVTLEVESKDGAVAKKLSDGKYCVSYHQDKNDKHVWYIDYVKVYN